MRRFQNFFLPILCLVVAALAGCSKPGNDYSEYHNLPEDLWRYGDTIRFVPTHPDSIVEGRIALGIRHTNDFRYSTLWLEVVSSESNGKLRIDTLAVPLADSFGRWRGQGIGPSIQISDTVETPISHRSGSPVKVRHVMRADTLEGITQVGLFFIPSE